MNKKIALLALLGTLNLVPTAFGQFTYIVDKEQIFDQTGDSTLTPNASNPFRFQVQISSHGQDDTTPTPPNTFTVPGSVTPTPLNPPSSGIGSGQWTYRQDFSTQGAMDTAFPNGSYTLNIGSQSGSLPLNGDLYTNQVMGSINVTGTWSGNVYSILPGQNVTISTNSIAGFTSGNFRVGIDASPSQGFDSPPSDIQFDSLPGLTDSSGNITIPASLLQAGEAWDVQLEFNAFSAFDNSSFPGNTAVAIYTQRTNFTISAIPEPAETVLIIGTVALGFAAWRRRKSAA